MFELVGEDLRRACRGNQHRQGLAPLLRELLRPGTQAVLVYRLGSWIESIGPRLVRYPLRILAFPLEFFFCWRMGIFIPTSARIGPGFVIHTWGGGITLPSAPIGKNLTVVGGGVQMDYEVREIGDDVYLGPGTKVIGKVRIGHRARTGPNSVTQADVPDDCVVFGNPGRIIGPVRQKTKEEGNRRVAPATVRPGSSSSEQATPVEQS